MMSQVYKLATAGKRAAEYKYACIIQSLDDEFGDITVQALRLKNEDGTDFIVQPEDVFNVTIDCIDQILPNPQVL